MKKNIQKKKEESFIFPFLFFFAFFFFLVAYLFRKKNIEDTPVVQKSRVVNDEVLNKRQENILQILSTEGEVTVEYLMEKIKNVTERTLRRDMKKLEELGFSEKMGNTKGSKYIYTRN